MSQSTLKWTLPDAHVRFRIRGAARKIQLFHFIVASQDPDYPYAPGQMRRHPGEDLQCERCNSGIWYQANLTAKELKSLAMQISNMQDGGWRGKLSLKIHQFNYGCPGKPRAANVSTGGVV